jgi:hypothetical protein
MRFERRACRIKRVRRPAQISRDQRNLGFGNDTPRAGHRLFRMKRARGTSQERFRSNEIPELRHRDASKGESRCVVAQGDAFQGT